MKKITSLLVLMLLLATFFCSAEETTDPFVGKWQDPYYGRAVLRIRKADDGYDIQIRWGNSADSEGVWKMEAGREDNRLVYTDGSMSIVTYGEGGEIISEDVQYDDAIGAFTLTTDGKLLWEDSREERAAEFALEKMPAITPDAEELKTHFFEAIARQEPGTAGASLKLAATAADLLRFVDDYQLWDADITALRTNLLDAWTLLDDSTRRRFDEDMPSVLSLMEAAMGSYESVAGQFESAGAEDMAELVKDEEILQGWETLVESKQSMGNTLEKF